MKSVEFFHKTACRIGRLLNCSGQAKGRAKGLLRNVSIPLTFVSGQNMNLPDNWMLRGLWAAVGVPHVGLVWVPRVGLKLAVRSTALN